MSKPLIAYCLVAFGSSAWTQQPGQSPVLVAQRTLESEYVEPFKVFDNLYYVGIEWVAAWVVDTGEGLILIDALYGEFVQPMLENIRKLGLDPAAIKYVFCSHGHYDHAAGAGMVKALSGAKVGMTEADWALYKAGAGGQYGYEAIPTDMVMKDGDTITLGKTTMTFYVTPGHTPGVLSMEFTVYDGGQPHKAFMFGGVGLNFSGVDRCKMYIESVKRIQGMSGIELNVPNHASMGGVFEKAEKLKTRKPGEPHPFVAPEEYQEWLKELMKNVEAKLAEEEARAN